MKHTEHMVDDTTIADEQRSQVDRTWAATVAKCKPTPEPQQEATCRKDAATSDDQIIESVRKLVRDAAELGYERGAFDMLHAVKELVPTKYLEMLLDRVKSDAEVFSHRMQQRRESQQ